MKKEFEQSNKKLWFKNKTYGYGWVPCSWQGWLVLVLYIVLNIVNFLRIDQSSHSSSDTIRPFIIQVVLLTALLLYIARKKGEKPRWQWGEKTQNTDSRKED